MARIRFGSGVSILLVMLLGLRASPATAQSSSAADTESLLQADADGLPRIFALTEAECRSLLNGSQRWITLPRSINGMLARPQFPPAFEMYDMQVTSRSLAANLFAARASFNRLWSTGPRLIYNNRIQQVEGDEVWLAGQYPPTFQLYSDGHWTSYRPLGSNALLAKQTGGRWCLSTSDGLRWLEDGTQETIQVPGWPQGHADGMVSDGRGRILVWSRRPADRSVVTIFADGKWSTIELHQGANWTSSGIRPDGSAVLAGQSEFIIANPIEGERTELTQLLPRLKPFPISENQTAQIKFMAKRLPDGAETNVAIVFGNEVVSGTPAVTASGAALIAVRALGSSPAGLMRVPSQGSPEWIDFDPGIEGFAIHPARDDGFLLVDPRLGIYELKKGSRKPERIADRKELLSTDQFLGSDSSGRIYFRRGEALIALSPQLKAEAAGVLRELTWQPKSARSSPIGAPADEVMLPYVAAVDTSGALWYFDANGSVMKWSPGAKDPVPQDDRLAGATAIWPGRGGEMLFTSAEQVSLVYGKNQIATAKTLKELAEQHFDVMLAAAPLSSRDERRQAPPLKNRFQPCLAAPWLTVGKSLWLAGDKNVYRIRKNAGDADKLEATQIKDAGFQIIGPLASGMLILANHNLRQSTQSIRGWFAISEPDGRAEAKPLLFAPQTNSTGSPPDSSRGQWLLDAQGALWIYDYNNRSYRIEGLEKWSRDEAIGMLQFSGQDGQNWSYRQNGVLTGYDISKSTERRPVLHSYLEHLTPLYVEGDRVACLTPLGASWLRAAEDTSEHTTLTTTRIPFDGTPAAYLGHAGRRVFLMTRDQQSHKLVSFEMPE